MAITPLACLSYILSKETRYQAIERLCDAYINNNEYIIISYIDRGVLTAVKNGYKKLTINAKISDIDRLTMEVLKTRPHNIYYILPLMEYLVNNTSYKKEEIVQLLYEKTNFTPTKRYPDFIYYCLYTMKQV